MQKAGASRPSQTAKYWELLLGCDRVLGCLGDAELYDGLCFDLNRFAGLRVAAHAGFAMCLYQAAQSGDHEHAVFLGLFDCCVGQVLKKCRRGFVVSLEFLCQMTYQLCLGHARSHETSSSETLIL